MYKVSILNTNSEAIVPESMLERTLSVDQLPEGPEDIDPNAVSEILFKEDLQRLCNKKAETFTDDELLYDYWHKRLRHCNKVDMRRLALKGIIPRRLAKVKRMPLYAACVFAKAHKRAWRKGKKYKTIRKDNELKVGDGTSSDHLIYQQPGLVPQLNGILTSERFHGATVFMDHFSRFIHVTLLQCPTNEETLEAKHEYEKILYEYNHSVQAYRSDNRIFNTKPFADDCALANQNLTLGGIGAHHQNGIGEVTNRRIVEDTRVSLLHTKREWSKVITTNLWPFALKLEVATHNHLSLNEHGQSPISIVAGVEEEIDILDYHPFGCPVFVLDEKISPD